MPTFADLEAAPSVQTKLNNAITRTDWAVVVDDVTSLADLTYTTGSAFTVATGTIVATAKEGFSYEVQASGATEFDLQTGAAKLNVLPGPSGRYNFRAMLPAADGTTDDYPKLAKLLAKAGGGSGIYVSGPGIDFPIGRYFMGSTIDLRKAVTLRGDGGFPGNGWAELVFAANTSGICINRFNTDVNGEITPTSTAADFTTIEGLTISSAGGTDRTKHGIVMRARGTIRACRIGGFPGNGITIEAAAGVGGASEGNANYWWIQNVNCTNNKNHGFYCNGADANAGTAINLDCASNGRYGIWDSSFLGNNYIGCHVATNGVATSGGNPSGHSAYVSFGGNRYVAHWDATEAQLVATEPGTNSAIWVLDEPGAPHPTIPLWEAGKPEGTYFVAFGYRNDNVNSQSVFLGCYSEGGCPGNLFQGPCLVIGGQMGRQYAGDRFRAASNGALTMNNLTLGSLNLSSLTDLIAATSPTTSLPWRLQVAGNDLVFRNGNSGTRNAFFITGDASAVPYKFSVSDYLLGGVREAVRSAIPTTEFWPTGSYVRNSNVASGQPRGWRCTTGGTPGTWAADSNWP